MFVIFNEAEHSKRGNKPVETDPLTQYRLIPDSIYCRVALLCHIDDEKIIERANRYASSLFFMTFNILLFLIFVS